MLSSVHVILLFNFVICEEGLIYKNSDISDSNAIFKSNVKPASFEDRQEVPSYWQHLPRIAVTTQPNYKPFNKPLHKPDKLLYIDETRKGIGTKVTEKIVESPVLKIRDPFNGTHQPLVSQPLPQRGNVVDWFLGVVGIRPPDSNPSTVPPVKNCPSCTCGRVFKHKRIVGGIETVINGYPWMAALMYNNRFYCGGSLINNKYVLTAAHCVNGFSREKLSVVFLDHDRSTSQETQTVMRKIKNIYRHSSYAHGGNYNNDIALLHLDQEVPVAGLLKPVCLPPIGKSFTGYDGIAVGWGATKEHGSISNKLLEVTVPVLSNIDCRKTGYGQRITDNMLCAGFPDGKKDSCQGDSGGPLHVVNGTIHQIVGIVSWGEGCAKPNFPGVYTRVNRYISWIRSNTRDACYC
ncbi:trypsin-1-like [Anoplophora glabripennis]|uniref:trypsin-1-like n=1 Tax=Anoplophora glabripennis TaxID=217634 RepID=UPI00087354D2|nr:trypsin-1-like [Anoplophora glabripennis]